MKKFLNNINIFNFWSFFIGVVIFGLWLTFVTNLGERVKIVIEFEDRYEQQCRVDGWNTLLENCYWTENN